MDEMTLREFLASAVAAEPPMGPAATASLRAGRILRRRRLTHAGQGSHSRGFPARTEDRFGRWLNQFVARSPS
jgi:hypothetical protein